MSREGFEPSATRLKAGRSNHTELSWRLRWRSACRINCFKRTGGESTGQSNTARCRVLEQCLGASRMSWEGFEPSATRLKAGRSRPGWAIRTMCHLETDKSLSHEGLEPPTPQDETRGDLPADPNVTEIRRGNWTPSSKSTHNLYRRSFADSSGSRAPVSQLKSA